MFIYPLLAGTLSHMLRECPVHLMLRPDYQVRNFRWEMHYWDVMRESAPYKWGPDGPALRLEATAPDALQDVPAHCHILYPSHEQENPLLWAAAYHEIGHHLYHSLTHDYSVGAREPQWLVAFKEAEQDALSRLAAQLDEHAISGALPKTKRQFREQAALWVAEFFCDLVAICLIGPAYLSTLAVYSQRIDGTADSSDHPSAGLRVRTLVSFLERVQHRAATDAPSALTWVPEGAQCLADESPDPATLSSWAKATVPELQDGWLELVIGPSLEAAGLRNWAVLSRDCLKRIEALESLQESLLSWVPPSGVLTMEERPRGTTLFSTRAACIETILLAGHKVRHSDDLWERFVEPWRSGGSKLPERDAENAMSKLLTKAIADCQVEERIARNGTERHTDS